MSSRPPTGRRDVAGPRRGEDGSGLVSTTFGIAAIVAMLGLAANVALGLWTRSTVDAVAYDAARRVASTPADVDPVDAAERAVARARSSLGRHGAETSFVFEQLGPDQVVLHVRAPGVSLLPRLVDGGPTVGDIDRRVVVRRERG